MHEEDVRPPHDKSHANHFRITSNGCEFCLLTPPAILALPNAYLNDVVCIDFELKKVLPPPPLGNFADISYLEENFKLHLLRDVCTLCSGALVCDILLHMLL